MIEEQLYKNRFDTDELDRRRRLWSVLAEKWLCRWISPGNTVLDLGASDASFINTVNATRRIAVDINPALRSAADPQVEVFIGTLQAAGLSSQCDVILASNILEHLPDTTTLLSVLEACHTSLNANGRLLILQPNFKYTTKVFYDYLDHRLPLTDRSLSEALRLSGFDVELCIPRFLPYSAKNARWAPDWALIIYLNVPLLWRVFGRQMFIVARKPPLADDL